MFTCQIVAAMLVTSSLACTSTELSGPDRTRAGTTGPADALPKQVGELPRGPQDDASRDGNDGGSDLSGELEQDPEMDGDEAGPADGLEKDEDTIAAPPTLDYEACASLLAAGKRGYGACGAGEAVVIVNDGTTPEMTCCPLRGDKIFSADAQKLHQVRLGLCGPGEILTGMVEPKAPTLLCSALADGLDVQNHVDSIYPSNPSVLKPQLRAIFATYHSNDACLCPEGTVSVGGHSSTNDRCGEVCATVNAL